MTIVNSILAEGRKLVPLKDYDKPLLKLSKQDKTLIWQYRKLLSSEEKKLAQAQREYNLPGQSSEAKSYLAAKIDNLVANIAETNQTIRDIKKSAYQEQLDVLA